MNTDIELMQQVRSGNLDKLGILFERHKNNLYGYFFRISWNKDVSEDLVQNVFLRIIKYRTRFTGEGNFAVWMYSIAHNVFIDHVNKNKKYLNNDELEKVEEEKFTDEIIFDERTKLVEKAMQLLSPEKKELIVMSKYNGIKYKEIGEILDCSEGTVKVRMYRAINELKEIYKKLEGK